MAGKSSSDLWAELGSLDEMELHQVVTKLFGQYEIQLQTDPDDQAAVQFFQHLGNAIAQAQECNLNRR